jgi:hypothetical protein
MDTDHRRQANTQCQRKRRWRLKQEADKAERLKALAQRKRELRAQAKQQDNSAEQMSDIVELSNPTATMSDIVEPVANHLWRFVLESTS